jgi:hypothetical protein
MIKPTEAEFIAMMKRYDWLCGEVAFLDACHRTRQPYDITASVCRRWELENLHARFVELGIFNKKAIVIPFPNKHDQINECQSD